MRLRLIAQRGYSDTELPCTRTLRNKLNDLGYQLRKVRKCLPLKKIPKTDAIFEEVHQVNHVADQDDGILRISLDTKAAVKVVTMIGSPFAGERMLLVAIIRLRA
ncbi:MAG: hypothetical protein JMN29_17960, partial [gamma proteobacterium endosymbiont of Lamellibrachia anaximandri]|nr:hypothetical protein [gamma proteobacterium endosymbiont of Lamellibrachia anaximandri]